MIFTFNRLICHFILIEIESDFLIDKIYRQIIWLGI